MGPNRFGMVNKRQNDARIANCPWHFSKSLPMVFRYFTQINRKIKKKTGIRFTFAFMNLEHVQIVQ